MAGRAIVSAQAAHRVADRHHCSLETAWLHYAGEIETVLKDLEQQAAATSPSAVREPDPFTAR